MEKKKKTERRHIFGLRRVEVKRIAKRIIVETGLLLILVSW